MSNCSIGLMNSSGICVGACLTLELNESNTCVDFCSAKFVNQSKNCLSSCTLGWYIENESVNVNGMNKILPICVEACFTGRVVQLNTQYCISKCDASDN